MYCTFIFDLLQIFSSEDELLTSDDVNYFLQSCYELSSATSSTCVFSDEIAKMFLAAVVSCSVFFEVAVHSE